MPSTIRGKATVYINATTVTKHPTVNRDMLPWQVRLAATEWKTWSDYRSAIPRLDAVLKSLEKSCLGYTIVRVDESYGQMLPTAVSVAWTGRRVEPIRHTRPHRRRVAVADWKPNPFEAEYRLDWAVRGNGHMSGWVIQHSSGLALFKPGSEGEYDVDMTEDWRICHREKGHSIGIPYSRFKTAISRLLAAAEFGGWERPAAEIVTSETRNAWKAWLADRGWDNA